METDQDKALTRKNYSFYKANIVLPRVRRVENFLESSPVVSSATTNNNVPAVTMTKKTDTQQQQQHIVSNFTDSGNATEHSIKNDETLKGSNHDTNVETSSNNRKSRRQSDELNQRLFIPQPPSEPKVKPSRTNNNVTNQPFFRVLRNNKLAPMVETPSHSNTTNIDSKADKNTEKDIDVNTKNDMQRNNVDIISAYKEFLDKHYKDELGNTNGTLSCSSSGSEISVSSLTDSYASDNEFGDKTLTRTSFEPMYSLPRKDKGFLIDSTNTNILNKIVISNSRTTCNQDCSLSIYKTGSLPDLRSIENFNIKRVSHVTKNESEAESEPGAQIGYKFRPLPPIPGTSSNIGSTGLYETIDGLSKFTKNTSVRKEPDDKRRSFKQIANFLTLVPRLTTNAVRSRKNDHCLADISQYLPDKKLKIFIGTWNMKGTKVNNTKIIYSA